MPRQVNLLIFDDAEVLDVAGPFEVFSVAGRRQGLEPFRVTLVAEHAAPVTLRNGFRLTPHATLAAAGPAPVVLVPGGQGTRREMHNPVVLDWVRRQAESAELVLSVCTGALVLGRAGLLDELDATTHHAAMDELREAAPRARLRPGARVVDNGGVILSAGVSAGIDMALHVVGRLLGREAAAETATYMEYRWESSGGGVGGRA
jgi:transcriptional regulator GlxA family with amidase domain